MQSYMPVTAAGLGGQGPRWRLFHEMQLMERAIRRLNSSALTDLHSAAGIPANPLDGHIAWMAGPLLQIASCCHALYQPAARAALGPYVSGLDLSPGERAVLLGQFPSAAVMLASSDSDREPVSGSSAASLRNFLRGVREGGYQVLGAMMSQAPRFFLLEAEAQMFAQLMQGVGSLELRQVRIFMRHIGLTMVKQCPAALRGRWLVPLMRGLVQPTMARLAEDWARLSSNAAASSPGSSEPAEQATEEVMREHVTREVTREVCALIQAVAGATQLPGEPCNSSPTALEFLLAADPGTALACISGCCRVLEWRDSDSTHRALHVCRTSIQLWQQARHASPQPEWLPAMQGIISGDLLRSCIMSLTVITNSNSLGEIFNLIRDVFNRAPPSQTPETRAVLLALPKMNDQASATRERERMLTGAKQPGPPPQLVMEFEREMRERASERDQRATLKRLLLGADGGLGALQAITNAASIKSSTAKVSNPRARKPKIQSLQDDEEVQWIHHFL